MIQKTKKQRTFAASLHHAAQILCRASSSSQHHYPTVADCPSKTSAKGSQKERKGVIGVHSSQQVLNNLYIYITGEIYSNWVVIELVVTLLLTCDASSYLSCLMSFNFGLLNLFRAKAQHMLRLSTDGTVSHLSINIICYLVRPCTEFVVFWTNIIHPHAIVER